MKSKRILYFTQIILILALISLPYTTQAKRHHHVRTTCCDYVVVEKYCSCPGCCEYSPPVKHKNAYKSDFYGTAEYAWLPAI